MLFNEKNGIYLVHIPAFSLFQLLSPKMNALHQLELEIVNWKLIFPQHFLIFPQQKCIYNDGENSRYTTATILLWKYHFLLWIYQFP